MNLQGLWRIRVDPNMKKCKKLDWPRTDKTDRRIAPLQVVVT